MQQLRNLHTDCASKLQDFLTENDKEREETEQDEFAVGACSDAEIAGLDKAGYSEAVASVSIG